MVSFPVCCLVLPVRCIGRIGPTHAACPPQDPSSIPFSRNLIDSVIFHTIYLYLLRKLAFSRTKILAFVTAVPAGFSFSFVFSMFTSSYKTWLCFNWTIPSRKVEKGEARGVMTEYYSVSKAYFRCSSVLSRTESFPRWNLHWTWVCQRAWHGSNKAAGWPNDMSGVTTSLHLIFSSSYFNCQPVFNGHRDSGSLSFTPFIIITSNHLLRYNNF